MIEDYGASDNSAERKALFRVLFIAAALIAAGVSLWAWEDKEAQLSPPHWAVLGQKG